MFKIVYYPGTYGAYLEFVLNQCLLKGKIPDSNIVSGSNTCHDAVWKLNMTQFNIEKYFKCTHECTLNNNEKFIKIDFNEVDDIVIMQLLFRRAANQNIDANSLETGTYFTLVNLTSKYKSHSSHDIINAINQYTDITPYYNIKDPSWPNITSVTEFWNLPKYIIDECINVFGFHPVELSEAHPDAPRWVLRHMFKTWFESNLILPTTQMNVYNHYSGIYKLSLDKMYDFNSFKDELIQIGKHFDLEIDVNYVSREIYNKVITSSNSYKNSGKKCKQLIQAVHDQKHIPIDLNVFEEGYVSYLLEENFNLSIPIETKRFFSNTSEILTLL